MGAMPFVKRVALIAGPTASGKSALALRLAADQNGVIINADALQVYAELRVLTARPTPAGEALAPHRLYGHVAAAEGYSAARWLEDAEAELEAAWSAGLLPVVTGGTGLYFKALEHGLADIPPIDPAVRTRWRSCTGDLHAQLRARDPALAARLSPHDRQRLIRALEVVEGTGFSLDHWHRIAAARSLLKGAEIRRIFAEVPRAALYARAEARFDAMLEEGALDEVRRLAHLDAALPVMKAIGVPQLLAHLAGHMDLATASTAAKTATRHYIKRQLTWWRGQMPGWGAEGAGQTAIDGLTFRSH